MDWMQFWWWEFHPFTHFTDEKTIISSLFYNHCILKAQPQAWCTVNTQQKCVIWAKEAWRGCVTSPRSPTLPALFGWIPQEGERSAGWWMWGEPPRLPRGAGPWVPPGSSIVHVWGASPFSGVYTTLLLRDEPLLFLPPGDHRSSRLSRGEAVVPAWSRGSWRVDAPRGVSDWGRGSSRILITGLVLGGPRGTGKLEAV